MFLIFYTEHLESRNPSVTEQNRKIEPRRHKTEELGQKSLQYHQIAEETQRDSLLLEVGKKNTNNMLLSYQREMDLQSSGTLSQTGERD